MVKEITIGSHTPGPWEVWGGHLIKSVYGYSGMDNSQLHPAKVNPGVNSIANARLIAASPEMFDSLNSTPNPNGGMFDNQRILKMAIGALRQEGHTTLAFELKTVMDAQGGAIDKATQYKE